MSQKKRYISFFIFCAIVTKASAQSMIPMTSTMRTPMGNVPYTYYVAGPSYYHYYYNPANISGRHRFTIELKDDSTIVCGTKIRIDDDRKDYLKVKVSNGKRIIRPADTKSISRTLDDGRPLVGIPADSCWLFKVGRGKINLYSFLAEDNLATVVAIQEGDGPIVKLDKDNLLYMLGDDENLRKIVEKGKYLRAIELYNQGERK